MQEIPSRRQAQTINSCHLILEPRDAGEIEVAEFHGRDEQLAGFRAGGFGGGREPFHPAQGTEWALMEAEVAQACGDPPVLDQERPAPRHTNAYRTRLRSLVSRR